MSLHPQHLLVEAHQAELRGRADRARLARAARPPMAPGRLAAGTARLLVSLAGRLDGRAAASPVGPSTAGVRLG